MKLLNIHTRFLNFLSRKYAGLAMLFLVMVGISSCKKSYLDVVPDNVATIDNAFANRNEAEKYLFTLYAYLPQDGQPDKNPAFSGGDEAWTYWPMNAEDYTYNDPYNIARGNQNRANPYMNYWDGYDGKSLWQGIRACNIFLENLNNVTDLQPYLKARWIGEAKFLKAYFHWYLFRMYGPIPIVDKNLPITATPEQLKVYRQPVDTVVNYIARLIDDAAAGDANTGLPATITSTSTELGRITKVAALAIKARVLVTAASPLFNGNTDFAGLKSNGGKLLFNPTYDATKWTRAAAACKAAIDASTAAGLKIYYFNPGIVVVNDATKLEMNIRNAVCEKWNSELIWGLTSGGNPTGALQQRACPQLDPNNINLNMMGKMAPPMKMAELFYTKNGVPIEEDKTWDYANRFKLRTTTAQDAGMQNGYQTVGLHFDREARFYADMAFDGSTWFMKNGTFNIQSESGQYTGKKQSRLYSITGYFTKKVVNWNLVYTSTNTTVESYPWPEMRLSDLYLLYAESLNESGNSAAALPYINQIRARAGLNSVESSWTNFSTNPTKYTTVEGLRDIIRQERGIEMAFEGSRFWDLRRWKTAPQTLSAPIYGWDILQSTPADYNRKVLLYNPQFVAPRDYFWPVKEYNLQVNPNLVQNSGW
ncbi:RagB/SusD family nutrient uptake outer membrane protein [Mucilaginibacter flavus]|uniref:RagB/SusD family nutrient uptake outer membrane protein n=1 Tax=Mucilaginibacter flavus TaxID=931504 RepID=UPI0025B29A14|nr:RagB/SusD family nutrient uptake outer membrane protein [Mucilaginibacter flavus]MDN3583200.1 RagB/SusD family nutrient uptake outer membrane protein [Mucilaginibacter flavus]